MDRRRGNCALLRDGKVGLLFHEKAVHTLVGRFGLKARDALTKKGCVSWEGGDN